MVLRKCISDGPAVWKAGSESELRNLYPSSFCFHRGQESDTPEMNPEENLRGGSAMVTDNRLACFIATF